MTREITSLGRIMISPKAMATIAALAALQSYGVVGLTSKNFVDGIADKLAPDPRHGVEVNEQAGEITVDLFIVVEYGTRIASVATSVANAVQYQIERAVGLPVTEVNVHVQGLRISNMD
ncbi:MAG: Asp23/Gls24 family envelope stress response protein [Anaerolineales bacterium]|nr:Asp23/Gls24 family envelope stress response protein [Anaerolineales bacterium]